MSGGTSHTPKIARLVQSLFPATTTILAPSTSTTAINPSDLSARGAAIQASLIQEFEKEDIEQSTHPMVTVTPHLRNAIGVLVVSDSEERGIFRSLMEAETPVPSRRTTHFATPKEGGDVIVKICEGVRAIKVSKPTPKSQINGKKTDDGKDSDPDSDDDDDDEEEVREKIWKVGSVLAEVAVKAVKKGAKVEVTVNVGGDLAVQVTAREVGGKGGVRGSVEKPKTVENGKA